jgi:CHAD domain-containing protein
MALDNSEIQASIRKLRKSLKNSSTQLAPEDVHKLRTRVRRFAALNKTLLLTHGRRSKRLMRRLKRIRQKAGRVRDMDVLTSHLAALRTEAEQTCLTQLFEYLGANRYRYAAKLRRLLRKNGRTLRKTLRMISRELNSGEAKADAKRSTASTEAAAHVLHMAADLAHPAQLTRANLHPYRLKVKKLRDVIAISADGGDRKFIDALGKCKDAIGEWHDWEELIGIAKSHLDHAANCSVLSDLKATSKRKLDAALSITAKLRNSYVKPEASRRRKGRTKMSPVALNVVSRLVQ